MDRVTAVKNKMQLRASLIFAKGGLEHQKPKGFFYIDEELAAAVGGKFEVLPTPAGMALIINEEAQKGSKEENPLASAVLQLPVFGDVLYTPPAFLRPL